MPANFETAPFVRPFEAALCNVATPEVTLGHAPFSKWCFVRDDYLMGGTKSRFLSALLHALGRDADQPVVYSGPAQGGLQVALAAALGKDAHLFFGERKKKGLHPRQRQSLAMGATHHYSPMPLVRPTQVAGMAARWADENKAINLRWSLSYPSVINTLAGVVRSTLLEYGPFDEVWVAGGGGTLARGIRQGTLSFPEVVVHVVPIGRTMKQEEVPECLLHSPPAYKMDDKVKPDEIPGFICPYYDGKAFVAANTYSMFHGGPKRLFWNVIAPAPE